MSSNLNNNGLPEWLRALGLVLGGAVTLGGLVATAVVSVTTLGAKIGTLEAKFDEQSKSTNGRLDKLENKMDDVLRSSLDYASERARIEAVITSKVKAEALR